MEGTLLLTDTPGLGEPGDEGGAREAEALDLAIRADLLVFVVDQDLARADHRMIAEMAREGKRLIVALNKKDRLTEEDRAEVLATLRERLAGLVPPEDVVTVAAAPSPIAIRVRKPDGTTETTLEEEPPDLEALEGRVAEILAREGDALRAGNLLLRARRLERAERARIAAERRKRAAAIIERHQWLAAVTAFANPVLALGPMAAGAVQLRMLSEIAAVYDVPLSSEYIEQVGRQMVQTLFKLGIAEAAASVLGGMLKFNPAGLRGRRGRPGRDHGLPDPVDRQLVPRIRGAGAGLGRRRDAGGPDPPPRGHPPHRVADRVRPGRPPPRLPPVIGHDRSEGWPGQLMHAGRTVLERTRRAGSSQPGGWHRSSPPLIVPGRSGVGQPG